MLQKPVYDLRVCVWLSSCERPHLQAEAAVRPVVMDLKDHRHRSLTRGPCGKEVRYTSEDSRVPTQKSYSSSETLKAYDQESRLHYGGCMAELVHHEADEYPQQGNFTLAELGICDPAPHPSAYCSDLGLLHRGYSLSAGSDADSDPEGALSPERAVQLWGGWARDQVSPQFRPVEPRELCADPHRLR
ncbi:hypothetical protein SKAU_G00366570 [Synaphobranchus kaupii]|uniref:Teneurin N-terminal domain-containing protein n=1 Tax=Synaphobranchus kaupii TaxID=118154 RepID=A0A9Q1EF88_SYNKA|nr:hypothetical protein SKAU_G00366570 [Synaphobranchus kaupii]